ACRKQSTREGDISSIAVARFDRSRGYGYAQLAVAMLTRLQVFINANRKKILPARLARQANLSRQHLLRLRKGIEEPRLSTMLKLTRAAAYFLERDVRV